MDRDEVKIILKGWLDGSLDSHDWDYFISVKNKHAKLENIRQRAEEMWVENSEYLQPAAINPCSLSELGRAEVAKLLERVQTFDADV